ncbi:MAG: ribonuclease HI [Flavobacteriaceae bacterium]|jgi:ribonuclease HI
MRKGFFIFYKLRYTTDMNYVIFTDGASRGNPGPGGFGSLVVSPHFVYELGGREDMTTNNRMELSAVLYALKSLDPTEAEKVMIYSDSTYVIKGMTSWIENWYRNNWQTKAKTDVSNRDLWEKLYDVAKEFNISWQHIEAHAGIAGNERADTIATAFADLLDFELYKGSFSEYMAGTTLAQLLSKDPSLASSRSSKKSSSSKKAYSYISLVGGVLVRDTIWDECKARVSGKKALFRKATSKEHEKEIAQEWKADYSSLVNSSDL